MNKLKRILSAILISGMLVGLTACGTGSADRNDSKKDIANTSDTTAESTDTGSGEELKTVIFANAGGDTADLVNLDGIAQKQGYFDEELAKVGYRLEIKGFAGQGPEVNEAFAAGSVDVAGYGCVPFVVSHSNDIDTTLIGVGSSATNYTLVVQADSDINEPKDIEGKKIIMPEGTANQYFFEKLIEEYDIDVSKVEVINNGADARAIFEAGEADGWIAGDSQARIYEHAGKGKVIVSSSEKPEWAASSVLVVRTEYLEENPLVAVALLKAYIRAQQYIVANPGIDAYSALSGGVVTEEVVGKAVYYLDDGAFDYLNGDPSDSKVEYLQNLADFFYEKKFITKEITITDFTDRSYYDQAVAELQKEGLLK